MQQCCEFDGRLPFEPFVGSGFDDLTTIDLSPFEQRRRFLAIVLSSARVAARAACVDRGRRAVVVDADRRAVVVDAVVELAYSMRYELG